MKQSLLVVGFGALGLLGLQSVANANAAAFLNIPWVVSTAIFALALGILGAVAYRYMRGNVAARFILIALMVALANGLFELVIGSDPAYPGLVLLLIIPYVIACWLGAALFAVTKWHGERTRGQSATE